ncbi:primosomal protein DnaI [Sporosarcina highlanderae]|uniref:Primosomal protein DnaI n=1 Tax=Sporosarcina highlanderae TaxID=3035916 RepID=A0ABT8JSA1_9BACL|nr:primosomal protein DnaI [Sporosarcina highlanderae]MDN4607277.1 primosomal protein DnaI [Sporosarcina highlanderae]
MERIGNTMKRVFNASGLTARYEQLRNEVMESPGVQQFISDHSNQIDKAVVDKSLGKLYEYTTASHHCEKCPNIEGCVNVMKGFEPKLVMSQGYIDLDYVKCPNKLVDDERRNVSNMIDSMYMPKDVMEARLNNVDLEHDRSRYIVAEAAAQFFGEISETGKLPERGLYIHGPFGTGKSFILGAIANELANLRIRTVVVYLPEFLREMKQSIQDQTLNEKIDFVKKANVLMLDDFGAESMSAWARDEVLGAILQYRMAEKLPTFFTSNFNYDELQHHLTYTQRGEQEEVKAARIMERIKTVSKPIQLKGKNRRNM